MKRKTISSKILLSAFALCTMIFFCVTAARAQTSTFTYQGRLNDSAMTGGSGSYLMEFRLFSVASGGTAIDTLTDVPVTVSGSVFTVQLNFSAANAFNGGERFLEIAVRRAANETYTTLTPRQPITSAPYSIRAKNAETADTSTNALNVGGTPAAQIIKEGDARLSDSRPPAAGSGNYIQNQTGATQVSTNFSIDGTGAANIFNAGAQFNIGGSRILSNGGTNNLFVGVGAGVVNTGSNNLFVGRNAGLVNTVGHDNSFFGSGAGDSNVGGDFNSFFGKNAGGGNTGGSENVFAGVNTGSANTSGSNNSFFGTAAGNLNTTGRNNTLVGYNANVTAGNFSFASAFGANAVVNASDTIVLGKVAGTYFGVQRPADTVQIPGNLNLAGSFTGNFTVPAANVTGTLNAAQIPNLDAGKITSGTFAAVQIPDLGASYVRNQTATQTNSNFNISGTGEANVFNATAQFNIGGQRVLSVAGTANLFAGVDAGLNNTTGNNNSFVGKSAGVFNTTGSNNSIVGAGAGFYNTTGSDNSFFGRDAGYSNTGGIGNSFFGFNSGNSNTTGDLNSFVGSNAGLKNTTGNSNSFVGANAGVLNTEGGENIFVGVNNGNKNTTGSFNSFFGTATGQANTTGRSNTIIGHNANVGSGNLNFASAFGAKAVVTSDDTIVLGKTAGTYNGAARPADTVRIPGNLVVNGSITGNITVPAANVTGTLNAAQIPNLDASKITSGVFNAAQIPDLGASYVRNQTTSQANSNFNISGIGTAFNFRARGGVPGLSGVNNNGYTFSGNGGDDDSGLFSIGNGRVSLYTNNVERIRANEFGAYVFGILQVSDLPSGNYQNVQWDPASKQFYQDSSSRRFKENIMPLNADFSRLLFAAPKTYTRPGKPNRWEIGFIAEEFDALGLKPLVNYDAEGKPEGIRYDKITLYLTRIAADQQEIIERQQKENSDVRQQLDAQQTQIERQQKQINELTKLICELKPGAAVCQK